MPEYRQNYRHTDTLIATLCPSTWAKQRDDSQKFRFDLNQKFKSAN